MFRYSNTCVCERKLCVLLHSIIYMPISQLPFSLPPPHTYIYVNQNEIQHCKYIHSALYSHFPHHWWIHVQATPNALFYTPCTIHNKKLLRINLCWCMNATQLEFFNVIGIRRYIYNVFKRTKINKFMNQRLDHSRRIINMNSL